MKKKNKKDKKQENSEFYDSSENELEGDELRDTIDWDNYEGMSPTKSPKKGSRGKIEAVTSQKIAKGNLTNQKADITVKRNVKDMIGTDINKRNILHRAALEQDKKLIDDILKDYGEIIKSKEVGKVKNNGRKVDIMEKEKV